MDTLHKYVEGKCQEMCPIEEIEMREKEKMLHILEIKSGTEKLKTPKADRNRMVKSFTRSAAGKDFIKEDNLRPPGVLLQTISYLLFDVINNETLPFHIIYDFIADRLLSVRQDMVVQNISKAESLTILQPIVRFHAYAAYRLCDETIQKFDPALNRNHLQETLKRLLQFYDSFNIVCNDYLAENRPEFEALYILFNLGNEEALKRVLTIPKRWHNEDVKLAIELSNCSRFGNFIRLCQLMKKCKPLLAAVASLQLPQIRRRAFQVMSIAYHSKNLSFPMKILQKFLLYESESELKQDCDYYGIKCDDNNIYFTKDSFISSKSTRAPRRERFIENKLRKENLQTLLLPV